MKHALLYWFLSATIVLAADWPMWRGDAMRSATTAQRLPAQLKTAWTLRLPALEPAWQEAVNQDRMPYDVCYEPIVVGTRLFVSSSRNDSVTAYSSRTGKQLWRTYLDAPLRLPPVASGDRLFVVCDDGQLHVLSQTEGKRLGTVQGGADDRLVMGNGRLVSPWCARGGPVALGGNIYFGAGIWPFMGTSLHAIDAQTLAPVWLNDSAGSQFQKQPHGGSESFGGVAPQGALTGTGTTLFVPSGRSVPARFDASNGKVVYFHLPGSPGVDKGPGPSRKLEGGSQLTTNGTLHVNWRGIATVLYDSATGGSYLSWGGKHAPLLTKDRLYLGGKEELLAFDLTKLERQTYEAEVRNRKTKEVSKVTRYRWLLPTAWKMDLPSQDVLILAGDTLFAASGSQIRALRLKPGSLPGQTWEATVPGKIAQLLAADDRLFAVTREGTIHAFAAAGDGREISDLPPTQPALAKDPVIEQLASRLPVPEGWCVVYGATAPERLEAILRHTPLRVAAMCEDGGTRDRLRRHFEPKGLYGSRISIRVGQPGKPALPPHFAALVVHQGRSAPTATQKATSQILRPYGGLAWFADLPALPSSRELPAGRFPRERLGAGTLVSQPGPLPGAASWTHLYGDMGNTAKSDDQRVRLPLGLLWFGGNSHKDVLPRHAHGPTELVVGGRLFIQGTSVISARDVYTGMVLWRRDLGDLGTFGDYHDKTHDPDPTNITYNQTHIPGGNARGTNFVAAADALYLIRKQECLVLDPATGKTTATFQLPPENAGETPPEWVYIGVSGQYLVAGADFVRFSPKPTTLKEGEKPKKVGAFDNYDRTSCSRLLVLDRQTGKVKWQRTAEHGFRHSAICVGGNTLFCLDAVPPAVVAQRKRRGEAVAGGAMLALDLANGTLLWEDRQRSFGTWLAYSREHKMVVQCGRSSRDMLRGEPRDRMAVFKADYGKVVWDRKISHGGPVMLHGDRIILPVSGGKGSALHILTGDAFTQPHPITGEPQPWSYFRRYGCNSVTAAEHLLTFRSGAAGFCDLNSMDGTGNFGGFKSGCSTNLIAADGVLNAPDYTRTCTCSYQNQASLALVPMPDVIPWTANAIDYDLDNGVVRELGLNLGAPGDRRDPDGTLWFEFPVAGGPSPKLPVELNLDGVTPFQLAPSRIEGQLPWIAASGQEGLTSIRVRLRNLDPVRTVSVRVSDGADDGEEVNGRLSLTSSDLELTRDGKNEQLIAIRFRDLPIEATDEVLSARLRFTVKTPSTEPTKLRIRAEAADSAAALLAGVAKRATTPDSVAWSPAPWTKAGASGKEQTTPDVAGLLRQIIGRPGWKPGNAVVFLIDGTGHRCPFSANGRATAAPLLEVTYRRTPRETPPPLVCDVQLVFAEPREGTLAGQRRFAVSAQDQETVKLDLAASPGPRKTKVQSLLGVVVPEWLEIKLRPEPGSALPPVLSGIRVRVRR
ncbi:MAG: PQQ-binding-like beta-propeller repeat protein [Victivallales bacterium]|nr:PQQ-binding-like beta-propeller repeat protein [Victivallales bacterium]